MTADEFVAVLADVSVGDPIADEVRRWGGITRRPRPSFEHPADPVLDLLARYDVSEVTLWQLAFSDATAPSIDDIWHVATKSTDTYYVEDGQLLHMHFRANYPVATGLSSAQFLDVLTVYAHMIASRVENPSGTQDPVFVEYAARAAATSPCATGLDWFHESSRR